MEDRTGPRESVRKVTFGLLMGIASLVACSGDAALLETEEDHRRSGTMPTSTILQLPGNPSLPAPAIEHDVVHPCPSCIDQVSARFAAETQELIVEIAATIPLYIFWEDKLLESEPSTSPGSYTFHLPLTASLLSRSSSAPERITLRLRGEAISGPFRQDVYACVHTSDGETTVLDGAICTETIISRPDVAGAIDAIQDELALQGLTDRPISVLRVSDAVPYDGQDAEEGTTGGEE